MNKRLKYKVVVAGSASELEEKVNRDLRWGKWHIQGGLCAVEYPNAKDPDLIQTLWTQALVSSSDVNASRVTAPVERVQKPVAAAAHDALIHKEGSDVPVNAEGGL